MLRRSTTGLHRTSQTKPLRDLRTRHCLDCGMDEGKGLYTFYKHQQTRVVRRVWQSPLRRFRTLSLLLTQYYHLSYLLEGTRLMTCGRGRYGLCRNICEIIVRIILLQGVLYLTGRAFPQYGGRMTCKLCELRNVPTLPSDPPDTHRKDSRHHQGDI